MAILGLFQVASGGFQVDFGLFRAPHGPKEQNETTKVKDELALWPARFDEAGLSGFGQDVPFMRQRQHLEMCLCNTCTYIYTHIIYIYYTCIYIIIHNIQISPSCPAAQAEVGEHQGEGGLLGSEPSEDLFEGPSEGVKASAREGRGTSGVGKV